MLAGQLAGFLGRNVLRDEVRLSIELISESRDDYANTQRLFRGTLGEFRKTLQSGESESGSE